MYHEKSSYQVLRIIRSHVPTELCLNFLVLLLRPMKTALSGINVTNTIRGGRVCAQRWLLSKAAIQTHYEGCFSVLRRTIRGAVSSSLGGSVFRDQSKLEVPLLTKGDLTSIFLINAPYVKNHLYCLRKRWWKDAHQRVCLEDTQPFKQAHKGQMSRAQLKPGLAKKRRSLRNINHALAHCLGLSLYRRSSM